MLLGLGSHFRPSFSLSLLRLSFGRVGIRLLTGTMSGAKSSLFSPLRLQQVSMLNTVHGTGPMGRAQIPSGIIVSN